MSYKLLVVEDNHLLRETLEDFLGEQGFDVFTAPSAQSALALSYEQRCDLYILDVKLPDMDGFSLLKALRESGDHTPALYLTSMSDQESLHQGFGVGADDYIKKPFDLEELALRIRAILSRAYGKGEERWLELGRDFRLNVLRKRLFHKDVELDLHLKDVQLLMLLGEHQGRVVTKEMIYERLWEAEEALSDGALRVYINNLKKILGKEAISNIRGIGYRLETL